MLSICLAVVPSSHAPRASFPLREGRDGAPFVISTSFYIQTIRPGEKSFNAAAAPKIVTEVALFVSGVSEGRGRF